MGIICSLIDISLITAANYLIIDYDLVIEINGDSTINQHTTHITTTKERTKLGRIRNVIEAVTILRALKDNGRFHLHGAALHVFGKDIIVCQIHRIELGIIRSDIGTCKCAQHTFAFAFGVSHIVFYHVLAVVAEEHIVDDDV